MMDDYRRYRETALQIYQEQKSIRLELRGGETLSLSSPSVPLNLCSPYLSVCFNETTDNSLCPLKGVDTDELDSNVDDWEEETIEFFINEEIIPLGNL